MAQPTPEALTPFLKAEIEWIRINSRHPGLSKRQVIQAGDRALKKYWRAQS